MKKKHYIPLLVGISISILFTTTFLLVLVQITLQLVSLFMNTPSSVELIGGADGPSTIYVSSPLGVPLFYPIIILGFLGMLYISILLILCYRKNNKRESV